MLALRPYVAGDARLIPVRDAQRIEFGANDGKDALAARGEAWTLLEGGAPVAAGGLHPMWDGYEIAWLIAGDLTREAGRMIARACRGGIERSKARRIEAHVRADNKQALRFLVWLGFRRVLLRFDFGPDGADYWLCERGAR